MNKISIWSPHTQSYLLRIRDCFQVLCLRIILFSVDCWSVWLLVSVSCWSQFSVGLYETQHSPNRVTPHFNGEQNDWDLSFHRLRRILRFHYSHGPFSVVPFLMRARSLIVSGEGMPRALLAYFSCKHRILLRDCLMVWHCPFLGASMNWSRRTAKEGGIWDHYNKHPIGSGVLCNYRQVSWIFG